jgi:quercetin dioxygenase-like cupin family protein
MEAVMKFSGWILSAATGAALLSIGAAGAEESSPLPKGFSATPVLKSGKTADGDPFVYLQTQKPEIVSVIGTLEPKGQTALHRHPVPVFVYVLEGQFAVQPEGMKRRSYKAGEAFLESINMWHQGFNDGDQPAKLLVVFLGEEGKPTTEAKQ